VLHVNGIWAEEGASTADGRAAARAVRELAAWLGARDIALPRALPRSWRVPLSAL